MGRHHIFVAVMMPNGFFQMIEIAAAGIGFVAQHHARPLPIAHCAGAAVGQQIDVHVFGAKQEGVVAGDGKRFLALFARHHADRFDDFDFPRLGPRAAAFGGGFIFLKFARLVGGHWKFPRDARRRKSRHTRRAAERGKSAQLSQSRTGWRAISTAFAARPALYAKIFPGLRMLCGSSDRLSMRIIAISWRLRV